MAFVPTSYANVNNKANNNTSARHKPAIQGGQLKLCATPSPPFSRDGNISVAECMPL